MTRGRETTSLTPPSKNERHSLNFIMHWSNDLDSHVEIMSSIAICEKYRSIYAHLQLNLKTEFTYLCKDLRIRNCITGCVRTASSTVLRTLCPTLHWIFQQTLSGRLNFPFYSWGAWKLEMLTTLPKDGVNGKVRKLTSNSLVTIDVHCTLHCLYPISAQYVYWLKSKDHSHFPGTTEDPICGVAVSNSVLQILPTAVLAI